VLGWLAATVLRGRRRGFTFAAIAGCLAGIAALHVLNPHALIARVNINRAIAGAEIDGSYLRTLSADAVPTLLARMPALPEGERCRIAAMLEERWSGERSGGWRTWNLSDARARRLVAEFSAPVHCSRTASAKSSWAAGKTADGDVGLTRQQIADELNRIGAQVAFGGVVTALAPSSRPGAPA
jgi:hypothetical protein